jgi:hypothetical protein
VADIKIRADYDPEAGVWVAQSEDIDLVTEAESVEALRTKLPSIVLDLIQKVEPGTRIFFTTHSEEQLPIRAA